MEDLVYTEDSTGNGGEGGNFTKREYYVDPKTGMYSAVCVDVKDHGVSTNNWGKTSRKIQFAFQLATLITEAMVVAAKQAKGLPTTLDEADRELIGKRLFVQSKKMNLKLFPGSDNPEKPMKKSDLFKFLEDWSGKPLEKVTAPGDDTPRYRFDASDYIGKTATLMVQRNPDKNNPAIVYSNIIAISPLEEGGEVLELDGSYTRLKDRKNGEAPAPATEAAPADDSEVEIPWLKNGEGEVATA